jgi:predicted lysophospholipase L1 biosynthesis ABC-type transport system permease subunit
VTIGSSIRQTVWFGPLVVRLQQTLPAAAVVIGVTVLAFLIFYFVTEGLFLLAHQKP